MLTNIEKMFLKLFILFRFKKIYEKKIIFMCFDKECKVEFLSVGFKNR